MEISGSLVFICGCMFSGKTEELIRRITHAEYAKMKVQVFKSHRDSRFTRDSIQSHTGVYKKAIQVPAAPGSVHRSSSEALRQLIDPTAQVIAIDEVQFFDDGIVQVCEDLANANKQVVVAGLTLNFRGEPFGKHILGLLAKADELYKLTAICVVCGELATMTQRLVNGKPAKWNDPIYMEGGSDIYQAVCRTHHVIEKPPIGVRREDYDVRGHP